MATMTIQEARETLGDEEGEKLTDEQLQQLIWELEAIARMTIQATLKGEFKPNL